MGYWKKGTTSHIEGLRTLCFEVTNGTICHNPAINLEQLSYVEAACTKCMPLLFFAKQMAVWFL